MNKLAVDIGQQFVGNNPNLTDPNNINKITKSLIGGSLSLAGVLLLFILILGGIGMIRGAGNNDPKMVEQGKKAATSALIGFIVVFTSFWIVKLIEQITGLVLL